jgi:hypothetical protein
MDMLPAPIPWEQLEGQALSRRGTADCVWLSPVHIGIRKFLFTHFDIVLPVNRNNRNKACSGFVAEALGLPDVDVRPGKPHQILLERSQAR